MLGRNPAAVASLVALAESFALPVVEHPNPAYVNFPNNHPLHLGYDPAPYLDDADLIVVIDTDVPWIPHLRTPRAGTKVIHLGVNPIYDRYPIWGFPSDLAVQADSAVALPMLTEALAPMRAARQGRSSGVRRGSPSSIAILSRQRRRKSRSAAKHQHITLEWLAHCLDRVRDEQMIFINEYDLSLRHITLDRPRHTVRPLHRGPSRMGCRSGAGRQTGRAGQDGDRGSRRWQLHLQCSERVPSGFGDAGFADLDRYREQRGMGRGASLPFKTYIRKDGRCALGTCRS